MLPISMPTCKCCWHVEAMIQELIYDCLTIEKIPASSNFSSLSLVFSNNRWRNGKHRLQIGSYQNALCIMGCASTYLINCHVPLMSTSAMQNLEIG
jgi:hypothetical protein